MTGVPQAVPVLRLVPEFCSLPQPSDASWGRNSWASEYVCPRHHSLGSGREAKEKVSCVWSQSYPTSRPGYRVLHSGHECVYMDIYAYTFIYECCVYMSEYGCL